MGDYEPTPEVQPPEQRVAIVAPFACFVSLMMVYWVADPVVEPLKIRWLGLLIYAFFPIWVTFIILYQGCVHPELAGEVRVRFMLIRSIVILGGVLFTTGIMLCLIWFCLYAVVNGPGPG